MYQLISAIAKHKSPGSPWLRVDVTATKLADIYSTYEEVYFEVKNAFWTKNRTMLASALRPRITQMSQTLPEFFTSIGNNTLPTVNGLASIKQGEVIYADAYWAGYSLERAIYARNPGYIPAPSEADCLVMKKEGVKPADLLKYCLVTVNGLVHRVDADSSVNYVLNAFNSVRIARRHEVGIINFKNIGALQCVSITPAMVHRRDPNQSMANQLYIKSPVSTKNKTVALVMGGYLHLLDNFTFCRVGEDIFCLDTQSLPLIDRFYESEKLIDLSSLGLERKGKNNVQISRAQLTSDETLTKWMTLSQSFLVLINNDVVNVEREQIETGSSWGMYVVPKEPTKPLLANYGSFLTYTKAVDDGKWTLTTGANTVNNLLVNTAEDFNSPFPADNRIPHNREEISRAQFLRIYTDSIVIK